MREKLYKILNKIYGILMTISFFTGAIPLVFFIVAIIIGGDTGRTIAVFMYEHVYTYVIALASISIIAGWIAMYVGGKEGLSVKSFSQKKESADNK